MNIKMNRADIRTVIMANAMAIREMYTDPTPIRDQPLGRAQIRLLESYRRKTRGV